MCIIRHQPLLPALLKAGPQSPHGPQGNPEVDDDVMRVGLLLPTAKKSACESEWQLA
jgi:hypothetical protein